MSCHPERSEGPGWAAGAAIFLLFLACQPPQKPAAKIALAQPQIRATVVMIQTTIQPGNKTFTNLVVIAGDLARSMDELDHWRMYDVKKNEVTFVDDIAKTSETKSFAVLAAARRASDAKPLPDSLPRAQFVVTENRRPLHGIEAKQSFIRLGGYQRELWIAQHPLIPAGLFAMMTASRPQLSDAEGVMRAVDDALLGVTGFPLADHAEMPYGNQKMTIDRNVIRIEQRDVPAAWFTVPKKAAAMPPHSKGLASLVRNDFAAQPLWSAVAQPPLCVTEPLARLQPFS